MSESNHQQHRNQDGLLLKISNLRVGFPGNQSEPGTTDVLCGVDLEIVPGQSLAMIGDSGCGKSMTALAVCGLLPAGAQSSGEIFWKGHSLGYPGASDRQNINGSGVALVMQEPTQCLNPVVAVGQQIAESLIWHRKLSRAEARAAALVLLAEVQVPDPQLRANFYPHQLSGGMCQRVLLAAALACNPELLIADEPTTSLDPTVQREILLLLRKIIKDRGMALLFITHDHELVPILAQQVASMKDGRIISLQDTADFVAGSKPIPGQMAHSSLSAPADHALAARQVSITFGAKTKKPVAAVQSVDIELFRGEALGLAGESGCGKTTLARILSGHLNPDDGVVELPGCVDLYNLKGKSLRQARRKVQLMFQNASGSLNPRQPVGEALLEAAQAEHFNVQDALQEVGLAANLQSRYPHELSGGQKQRIALARALSCNPDILVADEPTTALDPQSRVQILELLSKIMTTRQLALLVISHDLTVLHRICTRVAVMYGGYVVEIHQPNMGGGYRHPYGQELWSSQPGLWPDESDGVFGRRKMVKFPADPLTKGCPYAGECHLCKPLCNKVLPPLKLTGSGDLLRCPEVGF